MVFRVWIVFTIAILGISLATGYRASRAARAPMYLLTKTSVVVEKPATPTDEREAEIQRRFAEAGEENTVSELEPMFVLGLLDGALPIVIISGLLAFGVGLIQRRKARRRIAVGSPGRV